jgi:hypothetical protein
MGPGNRRAGRLGEPAADPDCQRLGDLVRRQVQPLSDEECEHEGEPGDPHPRRDGDQVAACHAHHPHADDCRWNGLAGEHAERGGDTHRGRAYELPAHPYARRGVEGEKAAEHRGGREASREPVVERELGEQPGGDRGCDQEAAPDRRHRIAAKGPSRGQAPASVEFAQILLARLIRPVGSTEGDRLALNGAGSHGEVIAPSPRSWKNRPRR